MASNHGLDSNFFKLNLKLQGPLSSARETTAQIAEAQSSRIPGAHGSRVPEAQIAEA